MIKDVIDFERMFILPDGAWFFHGRLYWTRGHIHAALKFPN